MASTDFGDQLRGDEIEVYRQHVDNWIQNDLSNAAPAGQEKEFPKDWNMMDCELPVEDPEAGMENPLSAFGLSSLSSLPAEGHSDFMHPGFASNINPAVASGITHAVPEFSVPPREEQGRRTGSQPRYTAAEWEAKRTLIASLWIDQNKSLEETQHIMAEQHGFDAQYGHLLHLLLPLLDLLKQRTLLINISESAYKYKLKTWRMYKNIKARHKKLIQQIKQRRKDEHGKDTMFFLHGRRVDNSKIPARKPVSGTSTIGCKSACSFSLMLLTVYQSYTVVFVLDYTAEFSDLQRREPISSNNSQLPSTRTSLGGVICTHPDKSHTPEPSGS